MDEKYAVDNGAMAHWRMTADEMDQAAEDAADLGQEAGAQQARRAAEALRGFLDRFTYNANYGNWEMRS